MDATKRKECLLWNRQSKNLVVQGNLGFLFFPMKTFGHF